MNQLRVVNKRLNSHDQRVPTNNYPPNWSVIIVLGDSTTTQDMNVIKDTFVEFYSSLLGTPHTSTYSGYDRINHLITQKLSHDQSISMVQEITNAEIKEVVMSLNPHKAPGPDGYNARFFQKAWHIVGHEVTSAIQNFFRSGKLLTKANATIVALVPKVPNPSKVGDFRPISCCNTVYKCIAKILAKRLQSVLPILIDPIQSGFIKGRRIADNIFLTHHARVPQIHIVPQMCHESGHHESI